MKTITIHRRQVLKGAGGFTVALPFLPSLINTGAARAQAVLGRQPFFVAMTTKHGGVSPTNMYPNAALLTDKRELYPGHEIRWGRLQSVPDGTGARLSSVVRSPHLSAKIVEKINVLRGFDYPFYIGHHRGGHLGNFVSSDQGPKSLRAFVTIDQLMAWSSAFYPKTDGIRARSIVTGQAGGGSGASFGYSNTTAKTGVQAMNIETSSRALFDRLVAGPSKPADPAQPSRPRISDRVLTNYRSLRESNRRLSADDRRRLDDHIARLDELERVLKESGSSQLSCDPRAPSGDSSGSGGSDPTSASRYYGLLNDIIVAAFSCGTTRIATISVNQTFSSYGGNWHQSIAHQHASAGPQATLAEAHQASFSGVFADLVKKLDAVEVAPGRTLLDDALVQWTQESGWRTHEAQDMPIVTAGSAAGFFKTGFYVDYRSQNARAHLRPFGGASPEFLGLQHRQWLASVLQAMRVPRSEFEFGGKTGYGDAYVHTSYTPAVHADVINKASDPLAIIT